MSFCTKCGVSLSEHDQFCPRCGKPAAPTQPYQANVIQPPKKRELNVPMLIFSIIVIVAGNLPLGLIALIFTIIAMDEKTDQGEREKLKIAKILNIIGIVLVVVTVVVSLLITLLSTAVTLGTFFEFMQTVENMA